MASIVEKSSCWLFLGPIMSMEPNEIAAKMVDKPKISRKTNMYMVYQNINIPMSAISMSIIQIMGFNGDCRSGHFCESCSRSLCLAFKSKN